MAVYEFIVASYRIEKSVAKTRARAIESLHARIKTGETIVLAKDEERTLLSVLEKLDREGGKQYGS